MSKYTYREEWLTECAKLLADEFNITLPGKWRVAASWPNGGRGGSNNRILGQCFHPSSSADGHTEMLITWGDADPLSVAATLCHEMIHAAVGVEQGHNKVFADEARRCGLDGKPTATVAGAEFIRRSKKILRTLGKYPHAVVTVSHRKQSTRMHKVECDDCGYIARTSAKWLGEMGSPICPCNGEHMRVA